MGVLHENAQKRVMQVLCTKSAVSHLDGEVAGTVVLTLHQVTCGNGGLATTGKRVAERDAREDRCLATEFPIWPVR